MPVPVLITDLSQTAASNFPAGSNAPSTLDDTQRAHGAFIAQLRDGKGFTSSSTVASAATTDIGAQNSLFVDVTGAVTITSFGTTYNGPRFLRFAAALTLTHNSTSLILPDGANITTAAGDTLVAIPKTTGVTADGWVVVAYQAALTSPISLIALRSYLVGCTMSTAGSSTTMSIAAGAAMDSTNAYLMQLATISKTTAAWAVGTAQGGLDTGAIANSTWYHFYAIRRPDTGVVDVTFSTNATTPTLPANYTQYRRIGSAKTNGSAQWTRFFQRGDKFLWETAVLDIDSTAFVATSTLYTISTPLGIKTDALLTLFKTQPATGMVNFWAPDIGVVGASATVSPLGKGYSDSATGTTLNTFEVRTNTSSQIYGGATAGNQAVKLLTEGWIDSRDRDA